MRRHARFATTQTKYKNIPNSMNERLPKVNKEWWCDDDGNQNKQKTAVLLTDYTIRKRL